MGGKDPQPAHYRDYDHSRSDNGGVHVNSGIPNHAFYLVAMALEEHCWKTAGRIWFDAITDGGLDEHCSFSEFANRTLKVASSAHGSGAETTVRKAWHHVGVTVASSLG